MELTSSSSEDKRPQFGNRLLTDADDVFEHNAWDNVEWTEEQRAAARCKVAEAAENRVDDSSRKHYEDEAANYWDKFYDVHTNRFFKDRHWLFTEFPELLPQNQQTDSPNGTHPGGNDLEKAAESYPGQGARYRVFEMGCGVGNTIFPLLLINKNPDLHVYCADFSPKAIEVLSSHKDLDRARCTPFVCDATAEDWGTPFPEESLDVILFIFVLSTISPEKFEHIARKSFKYLKPGGLLLFRDYGRFDMAQLRFKKGKCLDDNFYVRGDGTRSYFFTQGNYRKL
ncbi:methyltransferase-like protein 2 [Galendromus occidentalis]|uniref:tRNA N(3)-methylcytidine methyltransferase n=1 Tax=Galendromus occidentalis TaxID=34638 RepID=A0AAJ7SHW8_9ACAR|nr:methyltransferase-like protein 2 [Galendromus occidentalis]